MDTCWCLPKILPRRTNAVVTLRESEEREIPRFCEMDQQVHAKDFIIATTLETHRQNFAAENIVYLSILEGGDVLAGYFILVREPGNSVEFRRILVGQGFLGIGQEAIGIMEQFCWSELGARRIWLDVFEDNARGMHIYEKLGYRYFSSDGFDGRKLFYYEKFRDET